MREFSWLPVLMGTLLGMIFGASSLYLVLKVGITVSASIPVAVISITLFRILSKLGARRATILENNIVQTAGSAGESIAFGIGVTMPAILILGFDLEAPRVLLVGVLGGLLGILMMIPLRRALIVFQHGKLKYPEGTACAEVLKAGAAAESETASKTDLGGAKTIFAGFGIGLLYKTVMVALKGWKEVPEKVFGSFFKGGSVATEISPELLGVGYIIGPYLGGIMCAGGVLAYLVLIPTIKYFGDGLAEPLAPGTIPIRDMSPGQIRGAYILYIGAGAVATGGIISMLRSLPTIWHGIKEGLGMNKQGQAAGVTKARTDQDLPMKFVGIGIVLLLTVITFATPLKMNFLGAVLIVVFGFLFATVSSRLTGEIGSSSNPISGMTVATLLLTCLIFLVIGWTEPKYYITALSVGAIVCIAASNAGTTSQDLKTGYLIGATPRLQQIAILIGAFGSALILGPILLKLNQTSTVYVPRITVEAVASTNQLSLANDQLASLPELNTNGLAALPAGGPFRVLHCPEDNPQKLTPGDYLIAADGKLVGKQHQNFSSELKASTEQLKTKESLTRPQSDLDPATYWVWQKTNEVAGPAGRYLVNDQGTPIYLVDPGINGTHSTRPDGSSVFKYDAPKATLMSYIIKGILSHQLPWGLVLIGVMIALTLEIASIPSLAFAVGVYLPLSSSSPIFIGGMIRWLVDRYLARKHKHAKLTPEQLTAEGDRSPGVLLASGYIAGGAIAGILIAFASGVMDDFSRRVSEWSEAHNPFYEGANSDLLALVPFVILCLVLFATGRELLFKNRASNELEDKA